MQATFGYSIFYVADVEATVSFYEQAFGMARKFVTPENDYGELATGDTTLAFVSNELAGQNLDDAGGFAKIDASAKPIGASITLLTDDVAAMLDQVLQAGGTPYTDAVLKPWGQTVANVRDINGILIEVATPVPA